MLDRTTPCTGHADLEADGRGPQRRAPRPAGAAAAPAHGPAAMRPPPAAPIRAGHSVRRIAAAAAVATIVLVQLAFVLSLGAARPHDGGAVADPAGHAGDAGPRSAPAADPRGAAPFLCSVTRVRNEHVKFRSFVRHHRREGFDVMLFLDDRSSPPLRSEDPRVRVRRVDFSVLKARNAAAGREVVNPYGLGFVADHVRRELASCAWVAYIDVDEFLTTRRNETATVREEIARSFDARAEVDAVHAPWILYGNDLRRRQPGAPVSDVTLEVLWRFNHSMHHAGFDTKTRDRFWEIGASAAPASLAAAAVVAVR